MNNDDICIDNISLKDVIEMSELGAQNEEELSKLKVSYIKSLENASITFRPISFLLTDVVFSKIIYTLAVIESIIKTGYILNLPPQKTNDQIHDIIYSQLSFEYIDKIVMSNAAHDVCKEIVNDYKHIIQIMYDKVVNNMYEKIAAIKNKELYKYKLILASQYIKYIIELIFLIIISLDRIRIDTTIYTSNIVEKFKKIYNFDIVEEFHRLYPDKKINVIEI